jgi:hypothetical protein
VPLKRFADRIGARSRSHRVIMRQSFPNGMREKRFSFEVADRSARKKANGIEF